MQDNSYDAIIKTVGLTYDEIEVLLELLNLRRDTCVSLSELITIDNLRDKIIK